MSENEFDKDYPTCPVCDWEDTGGYFEAGIGTEYECPICNAKFEVTDVRTIAQFSTKLISSCEDCNGTGNPACTMRQGCKHPACQHWNKKKVE